MAPQKINIKERLSDGEIDLSMSDLQDVPVKDIAVFKKVVSLDLSNNHLKTLPENFATLMHLTKLDLSKNQLTELPENFGDLVKLKYLDLYQNQLQYLPLSFHKLKSLKWLDLKDNCLVPAVAKVAGPCLDAKQCQTCAKDVVNFFVQVQEQIATDIEIRQKQKQKQLELNHQKEMENKKIKKKDKIKKKENNGQVKESVSKPSIKKNKKVTAALKHHQKSTSVFKIFFILVAFILTGLFVTTSIKYKYTHQIEEIIVSLYNIGLNSLPEVLHPHVTTFGGYVKVLHDKTGNITLEAVRFVTNSEIYLNAYDTIGVYINKIKEQYEKYIS